MSPKGFVAVVGAVLAVVGLILGFMHQPSVTHAGQTVKCGAAFSDPEVSQSTARHEDQMNSMVGKKTNFADLCEQKRGTFGIISGFLIGIGVLMFLGGLLVRWGGARE